jgi:hypothetical protein
MTQRKPSAGAATEPMHAGAPIPAEPRPAAGLADAGRRVLAATARYGCALADASADASRALLAEIEPPQVEQRGLVASALIGLAEGNVRYRRRWSEATRRLLDDLCAEDAARAAQHPHSSIG